MYLLGGRVVSSHTLALNTLRILKIKHNVQAQHGHASSSSSCSFSSAPAFQVSATPLSLAGPAAPATPDKILVVRWPNKG